MRVRPGEDPQPHSSPPYFVVAAGLSNNIFCCFFLGPVVLLELLEHVLPIFCEGILNLFRFRVTIHVLCAPFILVFNDLEKSLKIPL